MATERNEAIDQCPWLCGAPTGPNTPFDWPVYFVIDSFRVFIAVACVVLIAISIWAIRRSRTLGQKCRFAFAACMCIGAMGTEISRIGDLPHWRFVVYLTGVILGLWAYYRHLFCEVPARDRPHRNERSP